MTTTRKGYGCAGIAGVRAGRIRCVQDYSHLGAALDAHLTDLIQPAVFAQQEAYRRLGLRERVLALPAVVAIVLLFLGLLLFRHLKTSFVDEI